MDSGLFAALVFAVCLVGLSYTFNRQLIGDRLTLDGYRIALSASAVLLLAVLAESLINPLYQLLAGQKLWEYRVYPLHDSNVSALAALVWTAYGIHLHFTHQTLTLKLTGRWNSKFGKSAVFALEGPLLFEVTGNLIFLVLAGRYYAYYLPGELGHLTSVQVIPIYGLCIFIGLLVLDVLEKLPRRVQLPAVLFAAGSAWLLSG
jgi:hypothetical protein